MEGHRLPGRPVLRLHLPVVSHGLPAVDLQEMGSCLLMKKMQRQRFHDRRYIEGRE